MSLPAKANHSDSDLLTALMKRVRDDDMEAFHELFAAFRYRLESFIHQRVNHWATAEDLAQETFIRIFRARHRYQPTARFTTWAFTIAINLTKNEKRRRRHSHECRVEDICQSESAHAEQLTAKSASVEELMLSKESFAQISERLSRLPHRQRTALEMFAIGQESMAAIESSLGCSCNAVKGLLTRARTDMRRAFPELAGSSTSFPQ